MLLTRAVAAGLACLALAGCGGSGSADDDELYREVLVGLRAAASSNTAYEGIGRAKQLKGAERAVVDGLCDTAWQLVVNDETALLSDDSFILPRIRGRARALNGYTYAGIGVAMSEFQEVIDLESYDRELNSRYKKACNL